MARAPLRLCDRPASLAATAAAALEIAQKRRATLDRLRIALLNSEYDSAIKEARKLTGLDDDDESDRTGPSLH